MDIWDCVIVGGGHNGLVAAAYLARAGRRVLVLERRAVLGGCCSTEELWPGYRVSPAAYVISLLRPEVIRELGLREHGLEILPRRPSSFTPLPEGGGLVLGDGFEADREAIAGFSPRDARGWGPYLAFLERVAAALEPALAEEPPGLPPSLTELPRWWRLLRPLASLGAEMREAVELLVGAARPLLERRFESEPLRATLATDAVIGAFAPPSAPGTGYVLLHHVIGQAGGGRGAWGYVRGGMGGLADALESACRAAGAVVRRETEVTQIRVEDGAVRSVVLAGGEEIATRSVASSLDARRTMIELVGPAHLPEAYAARVAHTDYASASLKINLALDGLPPFRTGEADPHRVLRGTIHISPDLDYIERAFDDARGGEPSREPLIELTIPSLVDDTLAPPGRHVASLFVQYAPYHVNGGWKARREAFADRCLAALEAYAPGFADRVVERQVLAPPDLERVYGLTGGNIMQGAMTPSQLGPLRLRARTPVRGLYLCGAAIHPGGGVTGACGRIAARVILAG